jgi:hypothetical protein
MDVGSQGIHLHNYRRGYRRRLHLSQLSLYRGFNGILLWFHAISWDFMEFHWIYVMGFNRGFLKWRYPTRWSNWVCLTDRRRSFPSPVNDGNGLRLPIAGRMRVDPRFRSKLVGCRLMINNSRSTLIISIIWLVVWDMTFMIGINNPTWLIFFKGLKPPTRLVFW